VNKRLFKIQDNVIYVLNFIKYKVNLIIFSKFSLSPTLPKGKGEFKLPFLWRGTGGRLLF